jgi:hypothetical protein
VNRSPDFLIIGAMKSATSTLHDQLAMVDGIRMSSPKELYFFSDDPVFARGIDWYESHFADAPSSSICGESTTHYTKLPTYPHTVDRIAEFLPDARFVYVMRHPVDRLRSHYTHLWLERETTLSFHDAVDGGIPELVDYGRYAYQLSPFFERFGPDRVLPVFFDRLFAHKNEELTRVCRFIGHDGPVEWTDAASASNVTSERLQHSGLRSGIHRLPLYDVARRFIPESAVERARRRWRAPELPALTGSQLRRLDDAFDADLEILGSWLGISLTVESFRDTTRRLATPTWQQTALEAYDHS